MLRDIIVSRCRIKLLQILLSNPSEIFYVRQLVRLTGEEINAVRRELMRMEGAAMVEKENRGNRIYYGFNKNYVFYNDLVSLIAKTIGLGGLIVDNRNKIGKIKIAMLSGRYARGLPTKEGLVDLLVIGEIDMAQLGKVIKEEETKVGREINYTIMTKEEFDFRKKRRDPFLMGIIADTRIMLVGDEVELIS